MAGTAFVLGGTGLIGRALLPALVERGFEITVGSRSGTEVGRGVASVRVNREDDRQFDEATDGEFDLFVDVVAYNERHAQQLKRLQGRAGSVVVISSAAVYSDADGKTALGSEQVSDEPLVESDPVVAPDSAGSDYAGGKVALENALLESALPVTLLRPGAIFGPGDRAAREWHFVKRVLDGRRVVVLSFDGSSTFHQVSSANVARMILLAADSPGRRVLNCGDTKPRAVRAIADTIADAMSHEWETITFPEKPHGAVGDTPWSVPRPFVLDLTRAREEIGFVDGADYATEIGRTCEWLVTETAGRPWEAVLPDAAKHYGTLFDYAAEDEFLRRRRAVT